MNHFKMKTLAVALAIVGLTAGCDRNDARRDAYVPPEQTPIERSTTAQGTTDPSAVRTMDQDPYEQHRTASTASVDHEETLQFEGTALTDDSEDKLESLVDVLDKEKPVAVIVAMEEPYASGQSDNIAPGTANPAMNSTVEPRARADSGVADSASRPGSAQQEAEISQSKGDAPQDATVFSQRVENVRQFFEEQGVEVVEWTFENTAQGESLSDGSATERGLASSPSQEDVQQIRIVIRDAMTPGGISAL